MVLQGECVLQHSTSRGGTSPSDPPTSALCIPHSDSNARLPANPDVRAHIDIVFDDEECAITSERLEGARAAVGRRGRRASCVLTEGEMENLRREQRAIREALFLPSAGDDGADALAAPTATDGGAGSNELAVEASLRSVAEEGEEEAAEKPRYNSFSGPPQDQGKGPFEGLKHSIGTVKAKFMTAMLRSRLDTDDDGVLGVQASRSATMRSSIVMNKFALYNLAMSSGNLKQLGADADAAATGGGEEKEEVVARAVDIEDVSYVRKPNLARIIDEYEAMQHHPKYTLSQVVLSRRFHLYAHRFANAQYQRTLVYPTLRQPREMYTCEWLTSRSDYCGECKDEEPITEKVRTRPRGHRFVIAADTQFGILMDGFAMDNPSWGQEIEISRRCVAQINDMRGDERPLFVCVCGDLVDTESSFSGAIASWKKVMSGWERNLVFEQQVKDFKRVWAGLHPDIALVCLCGNHDVGNRPTRASIHRWTSAFGDEYLSFWANGTFNLCLNNCLFSNPTGAQGMFEEQLDWMERQLIYARENDATHIFVYGHFPWFLRHEEEADDDLSSYSAAPEGWGPPGSSFADSYFTIPYEQRKIAMALFRKYDVTACFSGHFHQNVVAQTSWGMPMIVTGPLSMNLNSEIGHELSNGETNGIGMRVVDVGEKGEFAHEWMLLDRKEEVYEHALEWCTKMGHARSNGR